MPVGTVGSVKSLTSEDLQSLGYKLILANTYHLALRPGAELVHKLGGLRNFMSWPADILTDSGGFQVFSLGKLRTIDDNGVSFRNHIDGSLLYLTPERVMEIQSLLDSQIRMPLDVCPPGNAGSTEMAEAITRTRLWYHASATRRGDGRLFAIVQGGTRTELRRQEIAWALGLEEEQRPDGLALGGFSVGESREAFWETLEQISPDFPEDMPVYAMGIGDPRDLVFCATHGVDMFDCVLPTRNARNGRIYLADGYYNIKRAELKELEAPLAPDCACPACQNYSIAYIRHLFRARELSYFRLASMHNLYQFARLMDRIREAISQGNAEAFCKQYMRDWKGAVEMDYLTSCLK